MLVKYANLMFIRIKVSTHNIIIVIKTRSCMRAIYYRSSHEMLEPWEYSPMQVAELQVGETATGRYWRVTILQIQLMLEFDKNLC